MDLYNNDIRYNKSAELANGELGFHDTNKVAWDYWYIFRYRIMNKHTKEYFQNNSDKVFFPYRKVRKVQEDTGKVDYVDQPMVPGYIFVHANLDDAIALGKKVEMNLWRKRLADIDTTVTANTSYERKALDESNYYSIKDNVMRQFIRAVEVSSHDFKILDASHIDLAKDDYVEIIAGNFKGYKGYLKSVNGSNGGLVIVPLEAESGADIPSNSLLNYGISAKSCEVAILSFAKGSRRATDQLNHASEVVGRVMKAYAKGETITEQQKTRLRGYIQRFSQVKLERHIQQIRLALMLYRIYTVLELDAERDNIGKILDVLMKECEHRKDKAPKRDRATAEITFRTYQDIIRQADAAYDNRCKAQAQMSEQ